MKRRQSYINIDMSESFDEQLLTPDEQKILKKRLQEFKRFCSDDAALTLKAQELRSQILADRSNKIQKTSSDHIQRPERVLTLPEIIPVLREPQMSPLSNWLAKTSIFAPRRPGPRKDTGSTWIELASPRGVTIFYNGPELDMADHTLYLNCIKIAEGRAPNERIVVNRANLLKRCGYEKIGKSGYEWLRAAFDRLMQANIKIMIDNTYLRDEENAVFGNGIHATEVVRGKKIRKLNLTLKIMGELAEIPDTGDYYFTLPPTSLALFAGQLYGYNDLIKRNKIQKGSRADLAAWLQSYICADHTGEHHPVLVETLWKHSASKSRLNDFTTRLRTALSTCQTAGVITSWEVFQNEKRQNLLIWKR